MVWFCEYPVLEKCVNRCLVQYAFLGRNLAREPARGYASPGNIKRYTTTGCTDYSFHTDQYEASSNLSDNLFLHRTTLYIVNTAPAWAVAPVHEYPVNVYNLLIGENND